VDVVVKGRHGEVTDRFRRQAMEKLGRVHRLDPKVIRVDVEVSREANPRLSSVCERVELTCASRGPVIRAEAAADDVFTAFDLAFAKLESRLRRSADRRRVHHGARTPLSVAAATGAVTLTEPAGSPDGLGESGPSVNGAAVAGIQPDGEGPVLAADGPFVVREKVHEAEPMTLDQALFALELVGHDFYLFVDVACGLPSVVYRRRAYDYGVIRLRAAGPGGGFRS
jgi:ribosomal subunit interface protein